MSATTFNYHFILPPDLMCQTRELPVFPKRSNEEKDIKVTIKKEKDWPFIIVILLGTITAGTATYALNSYFTNKSKPAQTANYLVKPIVRPAPLPLIVKEPAPVTLEVLKVESLPATDVKTISADPLMNVKTKTDVAPLIGGKSVSTEIPQDVPKVTKRVIPKSSSTIVPSKHIVDIDKLPISPPSLKEVERSNLPLTTPKFIVETEPSKVQKGGIFKRPARGETTEVSKTQKPTQKIDTTPQSLF